MRSKRDGIKPISGMFEKYKQTLKAPQGVVVEAFIEIVEDLFQYRIPSERVSYSTYKKIVYLNVSGALKSEILLKQTEILHHLQGRLGVKSAPKQIM